MSNMARIFSRLTQPAAILSLFCGVEFVSAQFTDELLSAETQASPQQQQQQTQQRGRGGGRFGGRLEGVYKSQVTPNWFADNTKFWYRNDLSGGAREFILVDAERGTRERAFDHEAVAKQIGLGADAVKLPIEQLKFSADGESVMLLGRSKSWRLNLKTGKLEESAGEKAEATGEG